MKYTSVLVVLALLLSIVSRAQDKFITVGSGGGFAGTATVYKITSKGKVFKGKGLGEIIYSESAKIKRAKAKKYIREVSKQTKSNSQFNHPGNLYYFIKYVEGVSEYIITWGDAQHPAPDYIQKLYQEINSTIGSAHFKPI